MFFWQEKISIQLTAKCWFENGIPHKLHIWFIDGLYRCLHWKSMANPCDSSSGRAWLTPSCTKLILSRQLSITPPTMGHSPMWIPRHPMVRPYTSLTWCPSRPPHLHPHHPLQYVYMLDYMPCVLDKHSQITRDTYIIFLSLQIVEEAMV